METAIVSLVCVAILLIGTVTTVMTSFNAANKVSDSLKTWEKQVEVFRGTDITITPPSNYHSGDIDLWVTNDGKISLDGFEKWDVIAQWQRDGTDYISYLTRVEGGVPGNNQWVVEGIYLLDGDAEVIEPDILNVGEKMRIRLRLFPALTRDDVAMITVSCANGVTAECMFQCN